MLMFCCKEKNQNEIRKFQYELLCPQKYYCYWSVSIYNNSLIIIL